ncbi:MAG: M20/M25/M40 family metallo-hydrolase [Candidatus Coatesbacteria bacterium]|nr:M20/M25/M40 family metallo-hydrolase [Candidatus Coatesbacteria bacterium]
MQETIRTLCQTYGPSGSERRVLEEVEKLIAPHVDETRYDLLGNLIARVGSGGRKLMFAAHADEIGLVVHYIDEKGYLRVTPLGGVYHQHLMGRRVEFANGTVGVIGLEQRNVTAGKHDWQNIYVDIGAKDRAAAEKRVKVGDAAAFSRTSVFQDDVVVSKALDDRLGCAVLVEALKKLGGSAENECHFVFTVQEELGCRGARTSAYGITPDAAYAVDVTTTGDTPLSNPMPCNLGEGVAIKMMDGGTVIPTRVRDLMIGLCEANGLPYQREVLRGGTTDVFAIQFTKEGVPIGAVSIPTRYVHQPSEMASLTDTEAAVGLIAALANADHSAI